MLRKLGESVGEIRHLLLYGFHGDLALEESDLEKSATRDTNMIISTYRPITRAKTLEALFVSFPIFLALVLEDDCFGSFNDGVPELFVLIAKSNE